MRGDAVLTAQSATLPPEAAGDSARRRRRKVPLKFWFGPIKLWSVAFLMEVEPWRADSLGASASSPDLTALPREVDGIYRPSEHIAAGEADWLTTDEGIRYIESRFRRRYIDLTTGFEAYLSKFSSKTRSTFRRKMRRFREASSGKVEWRAYRSASEMQAFHAAARQISARTYQEKLFDAGLPEDSDFVAGMLARAEAGLVRGFILFHGSAPIAYLYLPVTDGRVIYGYLGFDPAYASLSPGTVLQLLALEALFAEHTHRIFDFTEGEGEHKRLFATHELLCGNIFYLRPTLRNRTVVRLHLATRRLADVVDNQLVQRNLKVRLKHYLRGQHRTSQ